MECYCYSIRLFSGRHTNVPPASTIRSATEEDVSSARRLQQFNVAIDKDLNRTEKTLTYSQEKNRLVKYVEVLEERGFSVQNHPDSHSVFIKKTALTGENIVIDFWEDEVSTQLVY